MRDLLIQTGPGSQEESIPASLTPAILRLRRIASHPLGVAEWPYLKFFIRLIGLIYYLFHTDFTSSVNIEAFSMSKLSFLLCDYSCLVNLNSDLQAPSGSHSFRD